MNYIQEQYGFGGVPAAQYGAIRDSEKKQLRRQSIRAGLCLLAFSLIQWVLVQLLRSFPALINLYQSSSAVADVIEMFLYLCGMFLPFYIAYQLMSVQEKEVCDIFGKPTSAAAAVAAVVACFFFCTIGDYATNGLLDFMENAGFEVDGGIYESPTNIMEMIGGILQIAILPAFVEEFALRSVILQPMRRFGDRYAILMSAFVFAIMHGNLVQIPFAFIAGIAFGYYTIATSSIWVGVLAHFLNNLYSVILNYLVEVNPTAADTVYQIILSMTLVGGVLCVVLFWKVLPHHKLNKPASTLSGGEKTAVYIFTLPMVAAIIYMVVQTVMLIHYVGH